MEPYIIVVLVVAAFFAGRFFPTQNLFKKITEVARENAFHEARVRMYRAVELCGMYTCVSAKTRWLPIYPNGAEALQSVLLSNEKGESFKISCNKEVVPMQKTSVQLRNPADTPAFYNEGFGDLLEVVPIQAS